MVTAPSFSQITNRYNFYITLKTKAPLHISGNSDEITSDLPILKTADGRPYIPGSSIKGALRMASERFSHILEDGHKVCFLTNGGCKPQATKEIDELLKSGEEEQAYQNIYENLCPICQIFGGGTVASKLKVSHTYFDKSTKTRVREGVKINRETGTVEGGALFNYEYIQPDHEFTIEIEAENLTQTNKKVLAIALAQLKQNLVRFGGLQSRGLGEVEFISGEYEELHFSADRREDSIALLLGNKGANERKDLDTFLMESLQEEGGAR